MKHLQTKGNKKYIGFVGERTAVKFLKSKGYSLVGTNFLKKWGEIDVIVKKDNVIHFVEVKTVSCENLNNVNHETSDEFRPEDNVHPEKLRRMARVIQSYLIENNLEEEVWQFDVVTVYLNIKDKKAKVNLIEDLVL